MPRLIDPNALGRAMRLHLLNQFMPPRPDWNSMGPGLPTWFRIAIRKIDRRLTAQFFPPSSDSIPGGVNPAVYPDGVWAVCRRLPQTQWLYRKWVYGLYTPEGKQLPPSMRDVRLIEAAKDLWLRNRGYEMDRLLDEACQAVINGKKAASRDALLCRIAVTMRAKNMNSGRIRMSVPEIKTA